MSITAIEVEADHEIEPKAASVSTVEADDALPDVTEDHVAALSEEVREMRMG